MNNNSIEALNQENAESVLALIRSENDSYLRYFNPFDWGKQDFISSIINARKDRYFGIFYQNILVGFYMLRGFDQGYSIPSYGVYISSCYKNKGIAKSSLIHAFKYCKENHIDRVMLKVHPDNTIAKLLYEKEGFVFSKEDPVSGQLIYYREIL